MKKLKGMKYVNLTVFVLLFSMAAYAQTGVITGTLNVCPGSTTALSDTTPGGTWTSANPAIAIVDSAGIVTGVSAGTVNITYTSGAGNAIALLTVNAAPSAISGPALTCIGSGPAYADSTIGGTWSTITPSIGAIGSSSGIVTGSSSGNMSILYTLPDGCFASDTITMMPPPCDPPILPVCAGDTETIGTFCEPAGGLWTSGTPLIATIGSSSGTITGVSAGTAVFTYTISGCTLSVSGMVNVNPAPIFSSISALCSGSTIHLGDPTPGGTWSSNNAAVAIVGTTGTVTGVTPGTTSISYTLSGCSSSKTVTVNTSPNPYNVTGGGAYCSGGSGLAIGLSSSDLGVNYQLYSGSIAAGSTVPGNGTPLSFGPETHSGTYTVVATNNITGCTNNMTGTATITINPTPSHISGSSTVCGGSPIDLYDMPTGGIWSSSNPAIASVSGIGVVTGITSGTAIIDYTVSGCTVSKTVTVYTMPIDTVTGGGGYCYGTHGADVRLSGSDTGISYQLYDGSMRIDGPLSGTGGMIDFGNQTLSGTYTVKGTGTFGCSTIMYGSATVSILSSPYTFVVTGGGTYCPGGTGLHVGLTGSQYGTTYQLMLSGTPVGSPVTGTGSLIDFGPQTASGTYTVIATKSGCNAAMAGSAYVSIAAAPAVYSVASAGSYCAGGTGTAVSLSGSQAGVSYQLFSGASPIGTPIAGTGSPISFGPITTGTYAVTATNTATGCTSSMAGSDTIVTTPLPSVYNVLGGGSFCAGGTGVLVGLSNSNPGISYQLYNGTTPLSIVTGTGYSFDFGLQTAGGVYTVIATNTSTGCASNMADSAIVSITAVVTPSVSISSSMDTICAGNTVSFNAITVFGGYLPVLTWYVNGIETMTGSAYTYTPANGDIVSVVLQSTAACATPAIVNSSMTLAVNPVPVITGDSSVCLGSSTALSSDAGSTWFSSIPTVATIGTVGSSTGVVWPMSAGVTVITCRLSGCSSTLTFTVDALPSLSITTATSCGSISALTAQGATAYTWAPSTALTCTACATTLANPDTSTVYTVTGTNATGCSDTASVYVDANRICGYISCGATPYNAFMVWLIQFNPIDSSIISEDSVADCSSGGAPYYQFSDVPPGNYYVKAALTGEPADTAGYVPTYGQNSAHWYAATAITHAYATDSQHINMVADTVPPGKGYVGGYISIGSGSGTSGFTPAPGVLVFLEDIHNVVRAYTYTDEAGNYAFTNIALNDYIVFPENYDYNTIPASMVTLSSTADSARGVDFKIYTTKRLITPLTTGLSSVTENVGLVVYPNPSRGDINIRWGSAPINVNVVITDMAGQEVYRTTISGSAAETRITPGLQNGVYLLTVRSNEISYSAQLVIVK